MIPATRFHDGDRIRLERLMPSLFPGWVSERFHSDIITARFVMMIGLLKYYHLSRWILERDIRAAGATEEFIILIISNACFYFNEKSSAF